MAEEKQIKIKAKDEDLKGKYSNLMQVSHNKEEFFLDFFLIAQPEGILNSRVIVSPGHLKRMVKVLAENIAKYEDKFGKVEQSEERSGGIGFKVQQD
jgi:hypothetical protein